MRKIIKNITAIAMLMGIGTSLHAQFGSAKDVALRDEAVKLATAGNKEASFGKIYAIEDLNVRSGAMIKAMEELIVHGHKESMLRFGALQLDTLYQHRTEQAYKFKYENFAIPYADMLLQDKQYDPAYSLLKNVFAERNAVHPSVRVKYVQAMIGGGRYSEAVAYAKECIIIGTATPFLTDTLFQQAYAGLHGSAKDFGKVKEATLKTFRQAVSDSVKHEMISRPAPAFTLKDADGNMVSLASMKGKTVVLDFWATWCTPCKASFPMMKQAQERFRKNPDVVFLFIHCSEREANPVPEAVAYMKEHQFDFKLLFDLRDPVSKQSEVTKSYGVSGIPTKCVIDPAGNIRFQTVGGVKYTETEEMAVEHLVAMIELARKS